MKQNRNKTMLTATVLFVAVIACFLLVYVFMLVPAFKHSILSQREQLAKYVIEKTIQDLDNFKVLGSADKMSELQLKQKTLEMLSDYRFGGSRSDYVFVTDKNTRVIMHPVRKDMIGRSLGVYKEANGLMPFADLYERAVKPGGDFLSYYWAHRKDARAEKKITYVGYYKPWDWILGAGIYVNDIDEEIGKISIKVLSALSVMIFTVWMLVYILSEKVWREEELRYEAEERLEAMQKKYFTLFENMDDMVFLRQISNSGGCIPVIVEVNNAVLKKLGYPALRIYGRTFDDLVTGRPGYPKESELSESYKMADVLSGYGHVMTYRMFVSSDGLEIPAEVNNHLIEIYDERYVLSVARDITERKKYEDNQVRLIEKLQDINAQLEKFAYVTAHDLRDPLRSVMYGISMIAKGIESKNDQVVKEAMDFMERNIERMYMMIKDLLEYSRLDKSTEKIENIEIGRVLWAVKENLKMIINENDAVISYGLFPKVKAQYMQLVLLFQNLIVNAIKFRKTDVSPVIFIDCKEDPGFYIFSVADNGIGIEKQYYDKIFGIFEKLYPDEIYHGTGIGLTICKRIVTMLGGNIWVESEPGKGSVFYFTVPKEGAHERETGTFG